VLSFAEVREMNHLRARYEVDTSKPTNTIGAVNASQLTRARGAVNGRKARNQTGK
jgi:hypothetical protein